MSKRNLKPGKMKIKGVLYCIFLPLCTYFAFDIYFLINSQNDSKDRALVLVIVGLLLSLCVCSAAYLLLKWLGKYLSVKPLHLLVNVAFIFLGIYLWCIAETGFDKIKYIVFILSNVLVIGYDLYLYSRKEAR